MSLWPLGKLFLKVEQKQKSTKCKGKLHNSDYIKIKYFCSKKQKDKFKTWGELFAAFVIGKQLVSQKDFLQIHRINSLIEKWVKHLNRHFTDVKTQMANKYTQYMTNYIKIREMQNSR